MNRKTFDNLYVNSELWVVAERSRKRIHKIASETPTTPIMKEKFKSEIIPYWAQFGQKVSIDWQKFYSFSDPERFDKRYIPNDMWVTQIVPHFNSLLYAPGFQDKCLHNLFFPDVKRPETLVKNVNGHYYDDQLHLMDKSEAISILQSADRFIVKPSVGSSQGRGIHFYNGNKMSTADIENLFKKYNEKNFVIQKLVKQHADMAAIHAQSLNTVRVVSFLFKNEVHILSTVVRLGGGDSLVDNVAAGGFQCDIMPDGRLAKMAYTKRNGKRVFTEVHSGGMRFEDIVIPSFDKVIALVKREAKRVGHYPLIGWDIAIGEDGEPVFIEFNCNPGQNQMTSGPTFGEMTDDVLTEVFGKRGW